MLKLKLQYFGHLMRRLDSLEKTLMLGGIGGRRKRGRQRMRWLDGITTRWTWVWVNSGSWWWIGRPGVLRFMGSQRVGHDWATELNWTLIKQSHFLVFWYTFFNWEITALQFCVKLYTKLLVSVVQRWESIIISHTHTPPPLHLEPPFSPGISHTFTHTYTPLPIELPSSPLETVTFPKTPKTP